MSKLSIADLRSLPSILEEWCNLKEIAVQNGDDFETDEQLEDNRRWVEDFSKDLEAYIEEEYNKQ